MADLETKAAEMFAAGASVNAVSQKLCNRNYPKAKKLHDAWLAAPSGEACEAEAEVEPEVFSAPEAWSLSIDVPVGKEDRLLSGFTAEEKALAVQVVIQARMNALLEA